MWASTRPDPPVIRLRPYGRYFALVATSGLRFGETGRASYGAQRSSAACRELCRTGKGRATGRSILEKTVTYRPPTQSTLSCAEGHEQWSFLSAVNDVRVLLRTGLLTPPDEKVWNQLPFLCYLYCLPWDFRMSR